MSWYVASPSVSQLTNYDLIKNLVKDSNISKETSEKEIPKKKLNNNQTKSKSVKRKRPQSQQQQQQQQQQQSQKQPSPKRQKNKKKIDETNFI